MTLLDLIITKEKFEQDLTDAGLTPTDVTFEHQPDLGVVRLGFVDEHGRLVGCSVKASVFDGELVANSRIYRFAVNSIVTGQRQTERS
jgi:hypothetical protein